MQEDPTFRVHTDPDTGQTLISGMGELHLEIIVDRLMREFNVGANVGKPQVAYKETITAEADGEGRFIRQTGGRGQYGHAKITLRPTTGGEFVFNNEIVGGVDPEGVHQADRAGHPRGAGERSARRLPDDSGVEVELYDGSYHDVDSSEIAFKIAGSMAFQDARQEGQAGAARADHGGRGGDPRGVHGRRHRRPQLAPRPHPAAWKRAATRR